MYRTYCTVRTLSEGAERRREGPHHAASKTRYSDGAAAAARLAHILPTRVAMASSSAMPNGRCRHVGAPPVPESGRARLPPRLRCGRSGTAAPPRQSPQTSRRASRSGWGAIGSSCSCLLTCPLSLCTAGCRGGHPPLFSLRPTGSGAPPGRGGQPSRGARRRRRPLAVGPVQPPPVPTYLRAHHGDDRPGPAAASAPLCRRPPPRPPPGRQPRAPARRSSAAEP
ncbi:hypothetical protein I4F81_012324 [Pyropia yezoensis]|uniref:Uncharacterized protein n=1 Tax=Pyropia yezoensis TaxID=2788 RepID=A0ACC3CIV0_PYRYE|nr:hypothetical protein I4F81_012324 [Neopyropia yezoensis]